MYEDEMNRYRVEIPEFESSDDDEIFDFLTNDNNDIISEIDIGTGDNNG